VVQIGRTVLGRPINMFIIGFLTAPRHVNAVAGACPVGRDRHRSPCCSI